MLVLSILEVFTCNSITVYQLSLNCDSQSKHIYIIDPLMKYVYNLLSLEVQLYKVELYAIEKLKGERLNVYLLRIVFKHHSKPIKKLKFK